MNNHAQFPQGDLASRETHFRALFDHGMDAVFLARRDGSIISANPAACELFGMSEAELRRIGRAGIFAEDDPAMHALIAEREVMGKARGEVPARRADGTGFVAEISSVIFLNDDGEERASATVRDVSERKQAEGELRWRDRLLDMTSRIAHVGGWEADVRASRVTWSDEVCRIHGVEPGAVIPLDEAFQFYAPECRERIRLAFMACARDGLPYDEEYVLVTAEGRRRYVRSIGEAVRDAAGQITHVQGAFQDITEFKRSANKLLRARERFQQFADAMPMIVWTAKADGTVDYANNAFSQFGSTDSDELVAQRWLSAIHPDDRERCLAAWQEAVHAGTHYAVEVRCFTPDDPTGRWYIISAEPALGDDGRVVRWYGTAIDISERRTLEEQLRQSQRLEAVGQLTGGIAHDFNNLLTVILGGADVLVEKLIPRSPLQEVATVIKTAAEQGSALTRRLLAFGRRQPLSPRIVDINQLVAGMDDLLRRTLSESIDIEIQTLPGLWPALIDATELQAALLNLCLNARDAMGKDGRLTIETANARLDEAYASRHKDVIPGEYVLLAVSDTGPGITADVLQKVFDPFFTTKEAGKGTGLGLSMVYGFVKQSQGHIKVYSEPGQGTTVKLYLPRAETNEAQFPADGGDDNPDEYGASGTILVVEDDELVRRHAETLLAELGYEAVTASDGSGALEVIRARADINLLFTDVIMPGMNGRELAEAARKLRPDLEVLFTSGYTENAIVHHGRLDFGVHLLQKPYRKADLDQKLRAILSRPPEYSLVAGEA